MVAVVVAATAVVAVAASVAGKRHTSKQVNVKAGLREKSGLLF